MKGGIWLASLSTVAVVLAAFVTYTQRLSPGDKPQWLVDWALQQKALLAAILLGVALFIAICDWVRAFIVGHQQNKIVLHKILGDLSRVLFPNGARNNRLTLFNKVTGWRVYLRAMRRLSIFSRGHKWRALVRIRPRHEYLCTYLRPPEAKGQKSTAAFRVGDGSEECEGVAGLIWDADGQIILEDLPDIAKDSVRKLASDDELARSDDIKLYAEKVNIADLRLLQSCDNFARHFYGTLIRKSDGSAWGVLLLDSTDDVCPFTSESTVSQSFIQRFNDYARVIGRIVG